MKKKIKRQPNSKVSKLLCLKCRKEEKIKTVKCKQCDKIIDAYDKYRYRRYFCSDSCSSTFNGTGRKHSEATKEKISKSAALKSKGILGIKFYSVYSEFENKEIKLQGTWEQKYALWLNENKIKWVKDRRYAMSYVNDKGQIRSYYPDFYLPDTNEYIEIKGVWWGEDFKKMGFILDCNKDKKIVILQGKELVELGIKVFDYIKIPNRRGKLVKAPEEVPITTT